MNLYPNDYILTRDLCSEEFRAQDFPQNELQRKSSSKSDYLKLTFYPSLKKSIENNSIDEIQSINSEMTKLGFHLKDLSSNSYLSDYIRGERYVPLLFLALKHRSVASIQCLLQLGILVTGRMYSLKSKMNKNSRWMSSRSRTEELEYVDINDLINDLADGNELKEIFKQHSIQLETIPNETSIRIIEQPTDINSTKLSKIQTIMQYLFKTNQPDQNTKSRTCILS
jgi:hypothetical protein